MDRVANLNQAKESQISSRFNQMMNDRKDFIEAKKLKK